MVYQHSICLPLLIVFAAVSVEGLLVWLQSAIEIATVNALKAVRPTTK